MKYVLYLNQINYLNISNYDYGCRTDSFKGRKMSEVGGQVTVK